MRGIPNLIAKTQPLTEETLLKEIFGFQNNTFRLRKKMKYVLKQLKDIVRYANGSGVDLEYKQFVIYAFIRMWNDETIYDYNFIEAWVNYRAKIMIQYKVWFFANGIKEIQRSLIIV